jgi:uncharacterized membrane protein
MFLSEFLNINVFADGIPESLALLAFGAVLIVTAAFLRRVMDRKMIENRIDAERSKRIQK